MSQPCLTHEEILPDAAENTEFTEEKAGNTAWITQFLASVTHFLVPQKLGHPVSTLQTVSKEGKLEQHPLLP